MALRFPINSGSWSNPAIWSGSLIPTSVDDVHANNRAVIIDQDIIVNTLKTSASGSAVAGGGFTLIGDYTVVCYGSGSQAGIIPGSSVVLTYSGTGSAIISSSAYMPANTSAIAKTFSGSLTITGSLYANGGTSVLSITGPGKVNIKGFLTASSGNGCIVMYVNNVSPLILNVDGNIYNDTAGNGCNGIYINSCKDFRVSVTGSIFTNSTSGIYTTQHSAIYITNNFRQGTLKISGSLIAGPISSSTGVAPCIYADNNSYINVEVNGKILASPGIDAIRLLSANAWITLQNCELISARSLGNSKSPFWAQNVNITPGSNTKWVMWDKTQTSTYTLYAQGFVPDSPAPSNVRFGTAYLGGALSGSMVVPNSGSVLFGVQVDNGTGSYSVTADQISEAVWNKAVTTLTGSNSIGQRLANSSTVSSTGAQIAAFGI